MADLISRFREKTIPKSEFLVKIVRLKLFLVEPEPELEKLADKMDDPNFNPFEAKSTIRNSPSPTLAKPKSSGYSMGRKKSLPDYL